MIIDIYRILICNILFTRFNFIVLIAYWTSSMTLYWQPKNCLDDVTISIIFPGGQYVPSGQTPVTSTDAA